MDFNSSLVAAAVTVAAYLVTKNVVLPAVSEATSSDEDGCGCAGCSADFQATDFYGYGG
jgi:hypothetical protein